MDSWVASDQVRALSSGEAELYEIADGSARGIFTKHTRVRGDEPRTINIEIETDSTAEIGMCSRTFVGKTRHIQVRWPWIQDAIRDKVVRLKKVNGTVNEANMGTKDFDGPATTALIAETAAQASRVQTAPGLDRDSRRRKRRRSAGCSIPDVCDVERIASGKVVQHSSSGENN